MATALPLQLKFRLVVGQGSVDLFAVEAAGPSLLDEKRKLEDTELYPSELSLLILKESPNDFHAVPGKKKFRPSPESNHPGPKLNGLAFEDQKA